MTIKQAQSTDVLIIGAGPAGAVASALLAQSGIDVTVLEKQAFPRFSIGESLLAQSLQLIEQAGMLEAVQTAGFQYKNGAAFAHSGRYAEYNFADKSCAGPGYTYQVPRAQFDELLIRRSQDFGAHVQFQVEITAADFSEKRPRIEALSRDGETLVYRPRFVLDASGFGRTLPRMLNLETPSDFPVRGALFTQVRDGIASGAFDRQKILVTIHPEKKDVWYWLIPFSDGRASIGVVGDEAFLQSLHGSNEERLWAAQAQCPELDRMLSTATPLIPVGKLQGYSANVRQMHGPGFALLGNAAEFLDPVFSSGVTIAMKSAHLAAECLRRQLAGEKVDWNADFETPLRVGVDTFRNFVDSWYEGSLQDIFFFKEQTPQVRRYISAILAGYAWDTDNPYVGVAGRQRLSSLGRYCRSHSKQVSTA